jgi:hypothetical protein
MSVSNTIADLYSRDLIISKLRWYIAGLEKRLAVHSVAHAEDTGSASASHAPLIFALDGEGTLHAPAIDNSVVTVHPGMVDMVGDAESAFEAVARVDGGFWVHPRPGKPSVACIGPFDGPPPALVVATVRTENAQSPRVGFSVDVVCTQADDDALLDSAKKRLESTFEWIESTPLQSRTMLSINPHEGRSWTKWALVLATRSLDDPRVEFGWATFKHISVYQYFGDRLQRSVVA